MPGAVFYWIFNMSIAASITGIAIMIIRRMKQITLHL